MVKEMDHFNDKKKIETTTKILELTWNRSEDSFRYSVHPPVTPTGSETKRSVLSVIARLYDQLGWIAPTIIKAKMFIQKSWLAGTTWDEPLSAELTNEWLTYRDELSQLTSVQIPRWLGISKADVRMELHGFCDASQLAYAAEVYVRVVDSTGNIRVSWMTAQDSSQWYQASSKENLADCASRGVDPGSLAENIIWFSGPHFLRKQTTPYKKPKDVRVQLEEAVRSHFSTVSEDTIILRFSSLQRLIRVVAYCLRFSKRNKTRTIYLSKKEIDQTLLCCIKKVQREQFYDEYLRLQAKSSFLPKTIKSKSLSPYLHEDCVMRVSDRLQKSQLAENTQHPIILPHSSHLTKLVVSEAHQNTLHGGAQLMINYLRAAYWIIGLKSLVKSHIRQCVTCVRQGARIQHQYMGSLPSVRRTPARAYLHSGVDYAGPIKIRTTKGRGHRSHKGYICLFVCMATRTVHLEVVSSDTGDPVSLTPGHFLLENHW